MSSPGTKHSILPDHAEVCDLRGRPYSFLSMHKSQCTQAAFLSQQTPCPPQPPKTLPCVMQDVAETPVFEEEPNEGG